MSDITAEKRLELIRTIREDNNRNRLKLKNRESILYGHGYETALYDKKEEAPPSQKSLSMTGFRILAAILLFSLFVIMDYTGSTYFDINAETICDYLRENYTPNTFDFMKEITYTFTHG